jgi:hypothetical protein
MMHILTKFQPMWVYTYSMQTYFLVVHKVPIKMVLLTFPFKPLTLLRVLGTWWLSLNTLCPKCLHSYPSSLSSTFINFIMPKFSHLVSNKITNKDLKRLFDLISTYQVYVYIYLISHMWAMDCNSTNC